MPSVRNLMADLPMTAPAAAPPPAPQPTPAPQGTLQPANPVGNGALTLPTVFAGLPAVDDASALPDPLNETGIYLGSASQRSPNWPSQQASGLAEGDFYVSVNGQTVKTMPLSYFLLSAVQFKTRMDAQGNFLFVTADMTKQADPTGQKVDEHLVALIVADVRGQLIPVKADFRGTKSGAVGPALLAVKQATDPAWAGLSDAHRISAAFPHPWGRVYATATTAARVAKGSGNRYHAGQCFAAPATADQMKRLAAALNDDQFLGAAELVKRQYLERVETLKRLAK